MSNSYELPVNTSPATSASLSAASSPDSRRAKSPRTATTLAYLGQTLVPTLHMAQREYIQSFGTDRWRAAVRDNHTQSFNYSYPPVQTSAEAPPPAETPSTPAAEPLAQSPADPPAPSPSSAPAADTEPVEAPEEESIAK